MIKVLEQNIKGKSLDFNDCEDGIYIKDELIAIIDGATSSSEILWGGNRKPGRFAMNILLEKLEKCSPDTPFEELLEALNAEIRSHYKNINDFKINPEKRLCASILIYNDRYKEVWSYGDCQYMINNQVFQTKKVVDELLANLRSFLIHYHIENGISEESFQLHDHARQFIVPLIQKQMIFQNKDSKFGYAVLDGITIEQKLIKKHKVQPGDTIVLASDGYPHLKNTLEASELALEHLITTDPLFYKQFTATKGLQNNQYSFDDRSYVKFIISN